MPAIAPILSSAAARATGIGALEKLQPGTCVVDTSFTGFELLPILSTPCLDDTSAVVTSLPNLTILKNLQQWNSGCGSTYTRVGYTDASGKYFEGWASNELVDCYTDDTVLGFEFAGLVAPQQTCDKWAAQFGTSARACGSGNTYAGAKLLCDEPGASCNAICCNFPDDSSSDRRSAPAASHESTIAALEAKINETAQLCSTWAAARGGATKACGAGATYDAERDDICDKVGKFCQVFCCDFQDEKAEFAAVASALNTTVAEVNKRVQTCSAWAKKMGGPAKACGVSAGNELDSTGYCDAEGKFCKSVCCDSMDYNDTDMTDVPDTDDNMDA
jgi:hypothetical protein